MVEADKWSHSEVMQWTSVSQPSFINYPFKNVFQVTQVPKIFRQFFIPLQHIVQKCLLPKT
jgi:hypothetical protein